MRDEKHGGHDARALIQRSLSPDGKVSSFFLGSCSPRPYNNSKKDRNQLHNGTKSRQISWRLLKANRSRRSERPATLRELRASGWHSKSVKREMYDNFMRMLARGEELFPGIIGYEDTVVPEINLGLIAQHDMLFLGEKGQGKSRLMRLLSRFLDEEVPYLDIPGCPVHEDPCHPITSMGKRMLAEMPDTEVPIAWWPREQRYAERLAPGTKFADIIGEIDPSKLASGTSMSAEEALHFGLIPRMHRGIFAVNELPELDELVRWACSTSSKSATCRSADTRSVSTSTC